MCIKNFNQFLFVFLLSLSGVSFSAPKIEVFVSILPQQYFVERIGGEYVKVNVMIKPGQSPATFEPSPKLMSLYSKADLFFTISMPFEQVWIKRVASLNQKVSIIATQPERSNPADPHTWLSPVLVLSQAKIIMQALSHYLPEKEKYFKNNYNLLKKELNQLHEINIKRFSAVNKTRFMTFHPAFFYFADLYGLTQVAIEEKGKEPSAKQMAKLIGFYQDKKIPYLLIEKQFNQTIPKTVANSLNSKLLNIDPLAKDYINNMNDISDKIYRSLF